MIATVSVVGVGLIGGSFALALRSTGFTGRILGVSSPRTLESALSLGVIDEGVTLEEGIRRADLVYLAQPISQILQVIPQIGQWVGPEAVVTDAGSTKAEIVQLAETHLPPGSFLGGHPMAGKESRGVEVAEASLFANRTYIFTPSTDPPRPNQNILAEFVSRFGCRIVTLSPLEHDRIVSYYSHVPQLASTALAHLISITDGTKHAAGPGLIDMTRLAMSSYTIWRDILATNHRCISSALDDYISILQQLRNSIDSPDIESYFTSAASLAKSIRSDF